MAISAKEAWPDRAAEPPPLSGTELATGCAAYAACQGRDGVSTGAGHVTAPAPPAIAENLILHLCLGDLSAIPIGAEEERAIPMYGHNERWSFAIRALLEAGGSCDAMSSLLTTRADSIHCEEDGCWASPAPTVTCRGDVASFDGTNRNCAHAFAHCSVTSSTGCTDRPPIGCHSGEMDKCDGDVKLGCDSCGLVTFHDCAWNGGHCKQTETGAQCEPAGDSSKCATMPRGCDQGKFWVCVSGKAIQIDCGAFGMACGSTTAPPVEVPDGGPAVCLFSSAPPGPGPNGCTESYCVLPN